MIREQWSYPSAASDSSGVEIGNRNSVHFLVIVFLRFCFFSKEEYLFEQLITEYPYITYRDIKRDYSMIIIQSRLRTKSISIHVDNMLKSVQHNIFLLIEKNQYFLGIAIAQNKSQALGSTKTRLHCSRLTTQKCFSIKNFFNLCCRP